MRLTEAKMSEDAKVVAGALFGMMQPGEGKLSFGMKQSRPTGRTAAALAELVFLKFATHEVFEDGTHVYRLVRDCSKFMRRAPRKGAGDFPITEKIGA